MIDFDLISFGFISTLPQGTEALQRELKKNPWPGRAMGKPGHKHTGAPSAESKCSGVEAAAWKPSKYGDLSGGHIHCFGETPSWKPPMPPWGLTKHLERVFQIPVVDETGLDGAYNIDLRWKVKTDPSANRKAVKQALIEQLGLELVPAHKPVEMLIVEKVNVRRNP